MKMKIIMFLLLAACSQSMLATWLTVVNQSQNAQYVQVYGRDNSQDAQKIAPGASYVFKNDRDSFIRISWQSYGRQNQMTFGPRYTATINPPFASLTAKLMISNNGLWSYTWGLREQPGDNVSKDEFAKSISLR